MNLVCVEFYGDAAEKELLAAVNAPDGDDRTCATTVGRLLCKMWKRDTVNAVLLNADGDIKERMLIFLNRRG